MLDKVLIECCRRDEFSVWMSLEIALDLVPVCAVNGNADSHGTSPARRCQIASVLPEI